MQGVLKLAGICVLFVPAALVQGSAANVCCWQGRAQGTRAAEEQELEHGKGPTGIPRWRAARARAKSLLPCWVSDRRVLGSHF